MEKDFEIEIFDEEEVKEEATTAPEEEETQEVEIEVEEAEEEETMQLPLNILSFGEIGQDDVKVYIKQSVYKALEKYAATDTTKELGTILLGDYCEQGGKMHVVISNSIEAKYTDASSSTLTFTHETWEYVHKKQEKSYADKKIIGWQHTHPNYGIFLSNYDMFIQENFFNLPFQVAYVIDPVQNIRGFFQWKDGKVEKLRGYYVYDEVGVPIKIQQKMVEKQEKKEEKAETKGTSPVTTGLLFVALVLLALFTLSLNGKYKALLSQQEQMITTIQSQSAIIQEQQVSLGVLEEKVITGGLVEDEKKDEENTVTFISYTVKKGETLSKICKAHGISYQKNKKMILAINGITDPSTIYVGQTILLPKK